MFRSQSCDNNIEYLHFSHNNNVGRYLHSVLNEDDVQIYSSFQSHIRVKPAIDEADGAPKSDTDLHIHAEGWAKMNFVKTHKGINLRSNLHSSEILSAPFSHYPTRSSQTAEDICSKQFPEPSAWNSLQLETCVHHLASCDLATCTHDLVRIIVSHEFFSKFPVRCFHCLRRVEGCDRMKLAYTDYVNDYRKLVTAVKSR